MPNKVLFVSKQRLIGRNNGSSVYLIDLANAARQASFIPHLLQPSPSIMGRFPIIILKNEMKCFEKHKIRGVIKVGRLIISKDIRVYMLFIWSVLCIILKKSGLDHSILIDRPKPYSISEKWSVEDHEYVKNTSEYYDVVIADYAFQSEAFTHFPNSSSAIIMHDLFHMRSTAADEKDSVPPIDKMSEIEMLSKADAVVTIQSQEFNFILKNVPNTKAILAPIGREPSLKHFTGNFKEILFVGSNTSPNVSGLKWLFNNVWQDIIRDFPDLTLNVIGSVSLAFPNGGPRGVKFHGHVSDIDRFYRTCGIVISPLTFGSGLKIKLIEALAYGKAIVATKVTLQGVENECSGAVICADTPKEFTEAIISLFDHNYRDKLARCALNAAIDYFSPNKTYSEFICWLRNNKSIM